MKNNINKKGQVGDILWKNAIYLILLGVFCIGGIIYLNQQQSGAAIWEQYSASEIVRVIDMAKPGDIINIDINGVSKVAVKNNADLNEMFNFDAANNKVCVKLTGGKQTCANYFNDVVVINKEIKLGVPGNVLHFEIAKRSGGA